VLTPKKESHPCGSREEGVRGATAKVVKERPSVAMPIQSVELIVRFVSMLVNSKSYFYFQNIKNSLNAAYSDAFVFAPQPHINGWLRHAGQR